MTIRPAVFSLFALLLLAGCDSIGSALGGPTPTLDRAMLEDKILDMQGSLVAHDPVIIKEGDTYYRFNTGAGIPMYCSPDLLEWESCGAVFKENPEWLEEMIPGVGDLWAPDIAFYNDKFYLYYAGSTFGRNHSAIGLATNQTLDPESAGYAWVDEGVVMESEPRDDFNAIDPQMAFDKDGQPWLAFGSFWGGIMLRRLDPQTGRPPEGDEEILNIARRPEPPNAIEGVFILPKDDEFVLFVSHDFCCRGVDSTYKIVVGRSKEIGGPYTDREGKLLTEGGGTLLLEGKERWRGPGHNSILVDGETYYLVYHAYDANTGGRPTLRVEELLWDDQGWPIAPSQVVGE